MDLTEAFFSAYTKSGFNIAPDNTPSIMLMSMSSEGLLRSKPIKSTLTHQDYDDFEQRFSVRFPKSYRDWHSRYFFIDADCAIIRLPNSSPTQHLEQLKDLIDWPLGKVLIEQGLIPFGSDGNDMGPLVFDTRFEVKSNDYPIRLYDHEYRGDQEGLSEIIFSSFSKLLECITHFLISSRERHDFEIIPEFFEIDPDGAGTTGKAYWLSLSEMLRENF